MGFRICSQDLPLWYSFSTVTGSSESILSSLSTSNSISALISQGTDIVIVAYVSDRLGCRASSRVDASGNTVKVTVAPPAAIAGGDAVTYLQDKVSSILDSSLSQGNVGDALNGIQAFVTVIQAAVDLCANISCSSLGNCSRGICSCEDGYSSSRSVAGVFCDVAPLPVNGYFENDGWPTLVEPCPVACGTGMRRITRTYHPAVYGGAENTSLLLTEMVPCNTQPCIDTTKVDGGWSDWVATTPCSNRCPGDQKGFFIGIQTFTRYCSNPYPANGGADCSGNSTEPRTFTVCVPMCSL
jgi:hypothetical protein